MIRVSAFKWVPPFAQGLVRDLRVRWALEEAGLPYEERLLDRKDQKSEEYLALQPFGQVPAYERDGLVLFESGAIVLHIAERSQALMPGDEAGRERAKSWMFSALNTVEPPIMMLAVIKMQKAREDETKAVREPVLKLINGRLGKLADCLGTKDYLEGGFTAGDLLMGSVLRILRDTDIVAQFPALQKYKERCEARPAFQKALAAQMAAFAANEPKG